MLGIAFAPLRTGWQTSIAGSTSLPIGAAPATPNTPTPTNGATNYYTLLAWLAAGQVSADVYLDTVTPPLNKVGSFVQAFSFVPTLQGGTLYYWQIVARNAGGTTTGPVWSFTTPLSTAVIFALGGQIVTSETSFADNITISETLASTANQATVTFNVAIAAGETLQIGVGTLDVANLLFAGEVQTLAQRYLGPSVQWYDATVIDPTYTLNKRRPYGSWTNVSVTTITLYLVATYAPTCTANHVQANLPNVTIAFNGQNDFMTCLASLATAMSSTANGLGHADIDYGFDVHMYLNTETTTNPAPITLANPPLMLPTPLVYTTDLSQVRTRVFGFGASTSIATQLLAGESIIPVSSMLFDPAGGTIFVAVVTGSPMITYASTQPSIMPVALLTCSMVGTVATAHVLTSTPHGYLTNDIIAISGAIQSGYNGSFKITVIDTLNFTYVLTALATTPATGSPLALFTFTSTVNGNPSGAAGGGGSVGYVTSTTGGSMATGTYIYHYTYVPAVGGETADQSGGGSAQSVTGPTGSVTVTAPSFSSLIAQVNIYRSKAGGGTSYFVGSIAVSSGSFVDTKIDAQLTGPILPTVNTCNYTIGLSSISVANGGRLPTTGGWLLVGNMYLRYGSTSGTTISGIPTSGIGSITSVLTYNATVTMVPAVVGVNANNGVPYVLLSGTSVTLFAQRDNLAAQAALGALELDKNGNPTDGIREYSLTVSGATYTQLYATCDADLAINDAAIVTAQYYTYDLNSHVGRFVTFNLASADPFVLNGTYQIQQAQITSQGPLLKPLFYVTASSASFSVMDVWRRTTLLAA